MRMRRCEATPNVAVADPAPETVHAAVPLHAPVQPLKVAPKADVAVSATERWNIPVHVPGQAIPSGLLVTVPGPFTVTETECSASTYGLFDRSGHPGLLAR